MSDYRTTRKGYKESYKTKENISFDMVKKLYPDEEGFVNTKSKTHKKENFCPGYRGCWSTRGWRPSCGCESCNPGTGSCPAPPPAPPPACASWNNEQHVINFLKKGISGSCIDPACHESLLADHPILSVNINTIINAHSSCRNGAEVNSNYVGPGTATYENIKAGKVPLSLTDRAALLHDLMYSCCTCEEEINNADLTLTRNLLWIYFVHREPYENIRTAWNAMRLKVTSGNSISNIGNLVIGTFLQDIPTNKPILGYNDDNQTAANERARIAGQVFDAMFFEPESSAQYKAIQFYGFLTGESYVPQTYRFIDNYIPHNINLTPSTNNGLGANYQQIFNGSSFNVQHLA